MEVPAFKFNQPSWLRAWVAEEYIHKSENIGTYVMDTYVYMDD